MDNTINPKALTINGTIYAHYELSNDLIFIKVRKNIIEDDESESEDFLIAIISHIEKTQINAAAYLNID